MIKPIRKNVKKAGAIIFNHGLDKILLIRGSYSKKWGVPKGSSEPGETVREAAIREVYEETGLTIEIDKYTVPVKIGKLYLYTIFVDEIVPIQPIDISEIMDIQWFPIQSLCEIPTSIVTVPFQKVARYVINNFTS
jgi:8-oxo-dGTP pyrophosphatase MutT (NUDIX family)